MSKDPKDMSREELKYMEYKRVPEVPVGTVPPLGVLPDKMHAWVIREDRFGEPLHSFQEEMMDLPEIGVNEALVLVMAAGVNYNGVWAGRGKPVSVTRMTGKDFHIAGSDASGIVWKVGENVKHWRPGDEVVLHCNQSCDTFCGQCAGYDPMMCQSQKIWGYETPYGSFAQFTKVQAQQLLHKPKRLSWEEAASYGLTYFTVFRMMVDRANLQPGEKVLVWGAAGGLGVFAVQLIKKMGAESVGVVNSDEKGELIMKLGAKGYINRKNYPNLAWKDNSTPEEAKARFQDWKAFGKEYQAKMETNRGPDVVVEHVGKVTFPLSVWILRRFGRVVICGATSGYDLNFDVRHLWMHQKSIIGSHFCNGEQAARANELVMSGQIEPVMTKRFTWDEIPTAHDLMARNLHFGKFSCLVSAPAFDLTNTDEARNAKKGEKAA
jgi:crotonyl-CoA carboxylase/reductase